MSLNTGSQRNISSLTFSHVICSFAVVYLHTNGGFWHYSNSSYWKWSNVFECLFYFAVPVFFMISGATLMDFFDRYSLKTFFKKRFVKTIPPFVFWSLVGLVYRLLCKTITIHDLTLFSIFDGVITTSYISIYWFFPSIWCLYLCLPMFSSTDKKYRKTVFSYFLIAGFLLNSFLPFLFSIAGQQYSWPISISVIGNELWYAVFGYMITTYPPKKKVRYLIYLLATIAFCLHLIGTYYLSSNAGVIVTTFKGYFSPICYVFSAGAFIFLQEIGRKIMTTKFALVINWLSKYTLSIYLVHYFVMRVVTRLFALETNSVFYALSAPLWVIPLSILLVTILRKIPFLRATVPQ